MPNVPHSITVNITRITETEDTAGGLSYQYTAAARGSLPTSCAKTVCVPMTQQERLEYGVRGDRIGWRFLSFWNRPQVDSRDQIEWVVAHQDGGTTNRAVKVITRDVEIYPDVGIYQWFGEDNTAET